MGRDGIWDKLLSPGSGWVEAQSKGKSKNAIRPSIMLRRDYHSLSGSAQSDRMATVLPEVAEVGSVRRSDLEVLVTHLNLIAQTINAISTNDNNTKNKMRHQWKNHQVPKKCEFDAR